MLMLIMMMRMFSSKTVSSYVVQVVSDPRRILWVSEVGGDGCCQKHTNTACVFLILLCY